MERRGEIFFISEDQIPAGQADLVVREAWWGHLIAGLLLLAIGFGLPAGAWLSGFSGFGGADFGFDSQTLLLFFGTGIAGLVWLGLTLVCLLGGFAFLTSAMAALRATNWVLRAGAEGLYIKLRSYADHRLGLRDPVVAFIPRREVRWLRAHDQRARHVDRAGAVAAAEDDALVEQHYLEIGLHGDDLSEIDGRLERERALYRPTFVKGVTAKAKGGAISIMPDGVLRIDWKTKRTRLRPALGEAMRQLASDYRVALGLETEQDPIKALSRERQEEWLLQLVQQGNGIDAVILSKYLYGFDTTEAKAFLDQLQGA